MTDQKHSPATPVLVAADESVCAAVQAFDLAVDLDLSRDFGRPSGGSAQWVDRQDAGRAVLGQGWPVTACPRSGTGVREPERSEGRTWEPGLFAYFCGCLTKVSRRKGGTRKSPLRIEWICTQTIKSAAATHQITAFGSGYK